MGKKKGNKQLEDGEKPKNPYRLKAIPIGSINESFVSYYRSILVPSILTESEFSEMLDRYKVPLPNVFRFSTTFPQYQNIMAEMGDFFAKIKAENVDIDEYNMFPGEHGRIFKVSLDKALLRRDERFRPFRDWLNLQTALGRCSRQEFVSMIPPYFLQVKPGDAVLDVCAAPGSKTAQIIEMLKDSDGFVFANDVDPRRCHNLVHQLQRVGTNNVLVTCQQAQYFEAADIRFDKVLCDVPCSGDGTLRKNGSAGSKWAPKGAGSLHGTQRLILKRGLELTKVGGICVYSTCSMNPIEDEAVVNSVCLDTNGAVEIVDCSHLFPDLKRHNGLTDWKVYDAGLPELGPCYEKFDDVPAERKQHNNPSMFCQPQVSNLDKCMRFFPQDHDSGGFFVTVLRKVKDFERLTKPLTKPQKPLREAPYLPMSTQGNKEVLESIKNTFEFDDKFPYDQLFVRNEQSVHNVVFIGKRIAKIITDHGSETFRTISCGAPIFTWRNFSKKSAIPYPAMEGVDIVLKYAHKRVFKVTPKEMKLLLKAGHTAVPFKELSEETLSQVRDVDSTGALFYIPNTPFAYGGMTFKSSISVYLRKDLLPVELQNLVLAYPELKDETEEPEKEKESNKEKEEEEEKNE